MAVVETSSNRERQQHLKRQHSITDPNRNVSGPVLCFEIKLYNPQEYLYPKAESSKDTHFTYALVSTSLSGRGWASGGGDNAGVYTAEREHSHTEKDGGPLPHGSVLFILKYGMLFFKYPLFFFFWRGRWGADASRVGGGQKEGEGNCT